MTRYDGRAENCIFCKIVNEEIPRYVFWESETHLAFLNIFPNTKGYSLVIPKKHVHSDILELDQEEIDALMAASKEAAACLKNAFDDVGRVGLLIEGTGVDHAHTKLFPMHGTSSDEWKQHSSNVDKYFDTYEGYISSHDGKQAEAEELQATMELIRSRNS